MDSLYSQLVALIGTPPNETAQLMYYFVCCFLVIFSIKLLYQLIFRFLLGIKK